MDSTRPAAERLRWEVSRSCGASYDVLTLDRREVANVMSVPAGWTVRNYFLKFEQPGAHVICERARTPCDQRKRGFLRIARCRGMRNSGRRSGAHFVD